MLTTEPLRYASLKEQPDTVARVAQAMFDPNLTTADLTWLRERWQGPLLVKGILTADDARRVVDLGATASSSPATARASSTSRRRRSTSCPTSSSAVGDRAEVYLDSGILNGADVVAAVAMGARACLVARAYCYGLMAGGERGVERALELLRTEIVRTMALLGARSVGELTPERVRLRPPRA